MDQSHLEGCIIYLDKLKKHLNHKNKISDKIINNFQILCELQQMSVEVLNSAQFLPELENDLLNKQHSYFFQMQENMQLNSLLLQNEFLKPLKEKLQNKNNQQESLINDLRQLINLSQLKYHQMRDTQKQYYDKSQELESMNKRGKSLLIDIQIGIQKQQDYQEFEQQQNFVDKNVKRLKEQYEFDIKTLNSFLEKIKENFETTSQNISKLEGETEALFQCKLEKFERIRGFFYKNGIPQEKITSYYFVERLKTIQEENQQKLLIEIYDQYRDLLNWTYSNNFLHQFQSYERQKQLKETEKQKENDFKLVPNISDVDESDLDQIKNILNFIFSSYGSEQSQPFEEDQLLELFSKLSSIENFLKQFKKKILKFEGLIRLQNAKGLYLKNVFKIILDQNMKYEKITIDSIYNILCIFEKLSFFDQEQVKNYFDELCNLQIWKKIDIWLDLYKYLSRRRNKKFKNEYIENLNIVYKNIRQMIKAQFEEKEKDQDIQKKLIEQNQKKTTLIKVVEYLKKLRKGINLQLFQEIIHEVAKVYKIQPSTTIDIQDKFEDEYILQQVKHLSDSRERNQKLRQFWGRQIVFKLCYQYLNFGEKFNVIKLNRKIHEQLSPQFYIDISYKKSFSKTTRNNLWAQILNIKNSPQLIDDGKAEKNLDISYKRIIEADINRTFTKENNFPRDQLRQMLIRQTYLMRETINYCQGMNYLAGYFLKYFKDKNVAFAYYYQILQNKMFDVFQDGFEKLQAQFYVLDKIIKLHLPDLANHFENIGVKSQYFASSWMITLFNFVLQETKFSYLVQSIMDIFMVEGYLGLYKVSVVILGFLENQIIQLNFDYTLQLFCNIQNNEIFKNSEFENYIRKRSQLNQNQLRQQFTNFKEYEFVYNFKELCNKVDINNAFVVFFEQRYQNIKQKLQKIE